MVSVAKLGLDNDDSDRYVTPNRRGGNERRGGERFDLPSATSRVQKYGRVGGDYGKYERGGERGFSRGGGNDEAGYGGRGFDGGAYGARDGPSRGSRDSYGRGGDRPSDQARDFPAAFGGGARQGKYENSRMSGGFFGSKPRDEGRAPSARHDDVGGVTPDFEWLPRNKTLEHALFGNRIHTGINFEKYENIPTSVSGDSCPLPITCFAASSLHPLIKDNVQLAGYTVPTPVQKYSISTILAGRDLMACAQTGSGKTAAFLLPILSHIFSKHSLKRNQLYTKTAHPLALILAPTRELAVQIFEETRKFSYRSWVMPCVAYGGAEMGPQTREMRKGCDVLVATPGRLSDFISRGLVSLAQVKFLVLDEADRMLDMGFEPQIRQIVEEADMPSVHHRQTLMYSATFPREIQRLAGDFLKDYVFLSVGRVGSTSENIVQTILQVDDRDKRQYLVDILRSNSKGLTLIFVETKRGAEALDDYLYRAGFPSTSIHGDRTQIQREAALQAFRTGECPIIVATAVAARGLDIPNVTHVINYDLPGDIDDYVHRIGRTGRAGNVGKSTSFFCDKNANIRKDLIEILREANQEIPAWLEQFGSGYGLGRPTFTRGGVSYGSSRQPTRDHRSEQGGGDTWGRSSATPSESWGRAEASSSGAGAGSWGDYGNSTNASGPEPADSWENDRASPRPGDNYSGRRY